MGQSCEGPSLLQHLCTPTPCPHLIVFITETVAVHEAAALGGVPMEINVVGQPTILGQDGFGERCWRRPPGFLLTVLRGVA